MKRYQKVMGVVALLALATAMVLGFMYWRQPRYEGKTVAQWFEEYRRDRVGTFQIVTMPGGNAFSAIEPPRSPESGKAIEALQTFGTNAAPFLANRAYPNQMWALYSKYYPKIPRFLKRVLPLPYKEYSDQYAAALALTELGSAAAPVIPDIIPVLVDSRVFLVAEDLVFQLLDNAHLSAEQMDRLIEELVRGQRYSPAGKIITRFKLRTPSAIRALARITQVNHLDWGIWWFLETMGSEAKDAVPILMTNLSKTNGELRYMSVRVLGAIGTNAAPALDAVRLLSLQDTNTMVRSAALRALPLIGPDWSKTNSAIATGSGAAK